MEQTYLEDTVSLSQNTNKLGVVTVHIPLANPSMTNTDHLCYRGHGMMWKTNLLSMTTSQKMKDLDRFWPLLCSNCSLTFIKLPQGHVQVSFLDNSPPQIVDENMLNVTDRSLHLGDIVKRRPEDMMSGVVTSGKMLLSLEHTFTGQKLENVLSEHVKSAFDFSEGTSLKTLV